MIEYKIVYFIFVSIVLAIGIVCGLIAGNIIYKDTDNSPVEINSLTDNDYTIRTADDNYYSHISLFCIDGDSVYVAPFGMFVPDEIDSVWEVEHAE